MVCYHNALGLARLGHQVTVYIADNAVGGYVASGRERDAPSARPLPGRQRAPHAWAIRYRRV